MLPGLLVASKWGAWSKVRSTKMQIARKTSRMKYLSLFAVAVFAVSAHAQTTSPASSVDANGQTSAAVTQTANATQNQQHISAAEATNLSAELTKKIDSKNAKLGDEVTARTTSTARLSDGTKLEKGTRLIGKVTDVQAKLADQKASRLAFMFDRAVLRNGSVIPIRATVMSLAAPAAMSASAEDGSEMGAGAGPAPVSAMASSGGRASGGGLLGGGGGAVRGAGNAVVNTTNGISTTASRDTLGATTNTITTAGTTNLSQMNQITGHVTNMPGVNLSSGGSTKESAVLNADGKNIALASGTQMTLSISANQ